MARSFPLRLARAVAGSVRDAVARRTAPPVVLAVREERLTRLAPSVLADLHERVVTAERERVPGVLVVVDDPGGGVAVVVADARSSAREVQVFGIEDRESATVALTRHGFRPESTRVTLRDGAPEADGEPVAVAHVTAANVEALGALVAPLAGRLAVGGVLVTEAADPARLAAVEAAFVGTDVRYVRQAQLHVVREG
ncbi:hypothetical protein [Rubrivirga marina]|uniref:Uncharacterized protein n=1 Tax=Rubrivirga marina TaxID=1196024 RepID=A0A271IVH1_9BACT|nr:hypothetical protein [Rubrivirga marina]PAP75246.1 hypothetical protein BSZ37_01710 [Rubrivirga marina]